MKKLVILIFGIAVFSLLSSCEKWRTGDEMEITFTAETFVPQVETRAHLFENMESFKTLALAGGAGGYGGYFHVDAYYTDNHTSPYLLIDSDLLYYKDGGSWRFYEPPQQGQQSGKFLTYYWPNNDDNYKLDFFAYAPRYAADYSSDKLYQSYVSVDNALIPPAFTVNLPVDGAAHNELVEFMYAYTPGQTKGSNPVNLEFQHPFAAISFNLTQARVGLEIVELGFHEMYKRGTYSKNQGNNLWSVKSWGAADTASLSIKNISTSVGQLGGTYLVLPQSKDRDGFVFYIKYLLDKDNDGVKDLHYRTASIGMDWEPGKKYTYNLDLGSSQDGVYFTVSVDPWDKIYDHIIPIE